MADSQDDQTKSPHPEFRLTTQLAQLRDYWIGSRELPLELRDVVRLLGEETRNPPIRMSEDSYDPDNKLG